MPGYLKTAFKECIIYANSKEGTAKGNVAIGEIKTEDDSSVLLLLSKTEQGVLWRSPKLTLQQNGHAEPLSALNGPILDDAIFLAENAVKRIKEKFGKTEYGTTYRVAKGIVEVITNP